MNIIFQTSIFGFHVDFPGWITFFDSSQDAQISDIDFRDDSIFGGGCLAVVFQSVLQAHPNGGTHHRKAQAQHGKDQKIHPPWPTGSSGRVDFFVF